MLWRKKRKQKPFYLFGGIKLFIKFEANRNKFEANIIETKGIRMYVEHPHYFFFKL